MKRVVVASSVLGFVFFPVFALQAEKLSAPLPSPKVVASANSEIVPAESKLRSTLVTVRYPEAADKKYVLSGNCATVSKAVSSTVSSAGIRTEILPVTFSSDCGGKSVELALSSSWKRLVGSSLSIPVIREESLFVEFADFSDDALFLYARNAREASTAFSQKSKTALSASGATVKDKLEALSLAYRASNLEYRSELATRVSEARKTLKYVVPVAVKRFPSDYPRIPGGGRPYRKSTTDGIHHWWDLMAPVGTPVRALADGVVVRTVSGFAWKDFDRIVKGANLSDDARHLNLDVYRGNQVWLKTADGNVAFYSHLSALAPDVREWKKVVAWEILWNVGVSGVPDRSYDEPHLHLEIQKNPHDGGDSVTPLSVMRWPYLGKWMGRTEVNALADQIFAKE